MAFINQLSNDKTTSGCFRAAGFEPVDPFTDEVELQRVASRLLRCRNFDRNLGRCAWRHVRRQPRSRVVAIDERTALIEELERRAPATAYISLIADGPERFLYEKFGFADTAAHGSIGMYRSMGGSRERSAQDCMDGVSYSS